MKLPLLFEAATFILFVGCTTAEFAPAKMNQTYDYRTSPETIELFRSASPSKAFIEIGAVSACCSADANDMIELLRKKASAAGGDALMGLDINAHGGATASVIRYGQ
jgi:hypothetical protein